VAVVVAIYLIAVAISLQAGSSYFLPVLGILKDVVAPL
jgi:hypothetical protein